MICNDQTQLYLVRKSLFWPLKFYATNNDLLKMCTSKKKLDLTVPVLLTGWRGRLMVVFKACLNSQWGEPVCPEYLAADSVPVSSALALSYVFRGPSPRSCAVTLYGTSIKTLYRQFLNPTGPPLVLSWDLFGACSVGSAMICRGLDRLLIASFTHI